MPLQPAEYGGGEAGAIAVTDDGSVVALAAKDGREGRATRKYLFIKADPANTYPVFLRLHDTEAAVYNTGIPLFPGEWHEISYWNMYWGNIRAVTFAGETERLFWHDGM